MNEETAREAYTSPATPEVISAAAEANNSYAFAGPPDGGTGYLSYPA